ncbi:MAG: tyrosine-protein phosphatase [Clostridia bacterium]|nr:tyrosine-protein phosphatase [Clostridia bacterium]
MKKLTGITSLVLALIMLLACVSCDHTHEFGEWTADENTHSRVCTVKKCEEKESGAHTYGDAVVSKAPGAQEEGQLEYTCTVCGYKKTEAVPQRLSLTLVEFEEFDTHTALQKKYLASNVINVPATAAGVLEQSYQATPVFTWKLDGLADDEVLVNYVLEISRNEDMSDPMSYTSRFYSYDRANGFNFLVRTNYYWQVTANVKLADGTEISQKSKVSTFKTLDGPRTLCVDGIANFRDLGGKDCTGGVLRQELIYRCGRLNANNKKGTTVSSTGLKVLKELGIKSEIDLRGDTSDTVHQNGFKKDGSETMYSWGGEQIQYFLCPAIYSASMLNTAEGQKMVKDTFEILAKPENYPVIFHCSIGTDRTGITAFLIEGVCGVDLETIERDYLFSNFANIGSSRSEATFKSITAPVQAMKGANFEEKCYNYLIKIGVTAEQIESVRNILIEKTN